MAAPDSIRPIWNHPRAKHMLNKAYVHLTGLVHLTHDLLPWFFRNTIWRLLLSRCGKGVYFDNRVCIKLPWLVAIGSDVSINRGVELYCSLREPSRIIIGSNLRIAPIVRFHAAGHDPDDPDLVDTGADIAVEDDVLIGAASILLLGETIGKGAIVAAGSVVSRDVPANMIAGGVPAQTLRPRKVEHGCD